MNDRYARLIRLSGVGKEGLEKLSQAKIALVGCGTLGGAYALNLVRMGVGLLRLIDRDIVEEHSLSAQILFDEEDVRQVLPKAVAAQRHLAGVNSNVKIEAHASELTHRTAHQLLGGVDLILDATDNFETRFLINDAALKLGIPWIYTGTVGFTGLSMAIVPEKTACMRCLMDSPPEAGILPTCETAGVWGPAAQAIVAAALSEALRVLLGRRPEWNLGEMDFESGRWRKIKVARRSDCPACVKKDFAYLEGRIGSKATRLCGRDMVHLSPERETNVDLSALAERLSRSFKVKLSDYLLQLTVPEAEISIFPDGRSFVKGVSDPARARAIFNRYIST